MVRTAVDDTQGMAAGGEIKVHRLDDGIFLIKEVNGHQIAHSGGHLIHQTAGLAEEHIFRILADHGDLRLGNPAVKEHVVDDGADQHLIGSRRGQTAAGQNGGLAVGIEAFHLAAQLDKTSGNTPDQGGNGNQVFPLTNRIVN